MRSVVAVACTLSASALLTGCDNVQWGGAELAVNEPEFEAASWHHQAMNEIGPQLRVVAHAPDGVVEAVEMPSHPWLFAVQWHPELTAAKDPIQQRLFDALVDAWRRKS